MSIFEDVPTDAAAITPSDTAENFAVALYVGGAGNVSVVTEAGTTTLFSGVPAGTILPIRVVKVRATGTTATTIVGFKI